jgi:hypothetical protein
LFVKYIIQNWGKSAGLMLSDVVYTERICVSVGLDLLLQRKNTVHEFKVLSYGGCLNRKEAAAGG